MQYFTHNQQRPLLSPPPAPPNPPSNGGPPRGAGISVLSILCLQSHPALLATVYTFDNAAGCHDAVVVASSRVVEYLVDYAL